MMTRSQSKLIYIRNQYNQMLTKALQNGKILYLETIFNDVPYNFNRLNFIYYIKHYLRNKVD
jgi:hypothetical protein